MKSRIWFVAATVFTWVVAGAHDTPRRIPMVADYTKLILASEPSFEMCSKLLMGPPKADTCSVLLVRSSNQPDDVHSKVEAVAFRKNVGVNGAATDALAGYERHQIAQTKLDDLQNVDTYVRPIMKQLIDKKRIPDDATVVVTKGSQVSASMLIPHARERQFIIEQESFARRFGDNLKVIAGRKSSSALAVFDFAPRSQAAIDAMGGDIGNLRDWQAVSKEIDRTLRTRSHHKQGLETRTLAALEARLKDPEGGVAVIYGHSNGEKVFLDTDEGIVTLGPAEIRRIGEASGGKLPPIILLNCLTRSTLAPAFLAAGSPIVMTSDRPLPIVGIATFIDKLSKQTIAGHDVIDSFFDVQRAMNLAGLRAVAANDMPSNGGLVLVARQ